jgi:hypothetical protein
MAVVVIAVTVVDVVTDEITHPVKAVSTTVSPAMPAVAVVLMQAHAPVKANRLPKNGLPVPLIDF